MTVPQPLAARPPATEPPHSPARERDREPGIERGTRKRTVARLLAVLALLLLVAVILKVFVLPGPEQAPLGEAKPQVKADTKTEGLPTFPGATNRSQEQANPTPQFANQDPLQVNTVWKGPGTQSGIFRGFPVPPDYDVTVRLTARKDREFEGEWTGVTRGEGAVTTGKIRGTIDPVGPDGSGVKLGSGEYTFSFEVYDLKRTSGGVFESTHWRGFIKGNTLSGKWEHRDPARNSDCSGNVTLQLVEK